MEYEVTLFQGDHSNEYLLCEMKEGQIEGHCQLFNRGILSLTWMIKNGRRVGGITEYKNGKAVKKEAWESLFGSEERRVIENSRNGLEMVIMCNSNKNSQSEDSNGNVNSELVFYRGGFDEEMNQDGYGIEYDRKNGKEKYEGYWEHGKLTRLIREFDVNNTMIEFDETCSIDILNRIPKYIGGYCKNNGKFLRNGVGYLIDQNSGTAYYEGEWKNGKEVSGIDLFDGWYGKGMKESIRSILSNDKLKKKTSKTSVNTPTKHIEIQNSTDLSEMDLKVTDLVISSNCCNELNTLDLKKFEWLRSIEIGDYCFASVQTFKIEGLKRLKSVKIGNNSFTQVKETNWDSSKADKQSRTFHILDCESLESIQIGEYSFCDFGGQFELSNLKSLKSIQIGTIGSVSYNFYYSSCVIRGMDMILTIE